MKKEIGVCFDDMSAFDLSFPGKLLNEAFELQIRNADEEANSIMSKINNALKDVPLMATNGEAKPKLVVDVDDDFIEKWKKGIIKLVEHNGKYFAQIREGNGEFGRNLDIKEEIPDFEVDRLENLIRFKLLEKEIHELGRNLNSISATLDEVLLGQQNDRLALYYSGISLYMESKCISDEQLRTELLSQAIKTLTDSGLQLTLALKADIEYLVNGVFRKEKIKQTQVIRDKISSIDKNFVAIHQISVLKAGIYCERGEFKALSNVMNSYSNFLSGTIANNAAVLSQCDPDDNGSEDGKWKSRGHLSNNIKDIVKLLDVPVERELIESEYNNETD